MAELTTKKRKSLRSEQFALPGRRAYPVNDRSHAANAKARATQMFNVGKLTAAERARINAKANAVLKRKT